MTDSLPKYEKRSSGSANQRASATVYDYVEGNAVNKAVHRGTFKSEVP
jgi:hypothetical protein